MIRGSARHSFALSALVEVDGDDGAKLHALVADEQQQRDTNGPLLVALVVDVDIGDREVGARRVRCPAELASNNHALDGPRRVPERAKDLDRRASEVARKSVLVEENSAMVLDDHVEVLRQRTVGDETCTLLHADHMPRAIEVRSQRARVRRSCRARIPGEDLKLECLTPIPLILAEGGSRRTTLF